MPVITEGMLRKLEKEGHLEKVRITEKDILTPSAREYLNVKKIDYRIKKSQEKTIEKKENDEKKSEVSQVKKSEAKISPKRQYSDYFT